MRGSDKALAPLDETLDSHEPGSLLLEAGALKPAADADDAEPRVVHVGDGATDSSPPVVDKEPDLDEAKVIAEMALTVPETDPEHLAYAMWNEGRADEAIEFLERHLAAERDHRRETALVPVSAEGKDAIRVEPASDWRKRHQAALSASDFNAFGASVRTVDITPTQADAVVPHSVRGSLRIGWLMGVCLALLCISVAGAYFLARDGNIETALVASQPIADIEPTTTATAVTEPEPELAAVEPNIDRADAPPPDEAEVADILPSADAADLPPPEENAPLEDVASVPPEEDAALDEVASIPPEENAPRDDLASAPPVDASLLAAPTDADVTNPAAAAVSAPDADAPETTASIESSPEAVEPQSIVEARLPRSRPEPPASFTKRTSIPQVVALEEPETSGPSSDLPLVVSEPPQTEAEFASVEAEVPVYGPDGPVRVYRHIRRIPYPPIVRRTFPRRSLTPAEYQALVERRAWAERYTAERRTGIVGRVITLP